MSFTCDISFKEKANIFSFEYLKCILFVIEVEDDDYIYTKKLYIFLEEEINSQYFEDGAIEFLRDFNYEDADVDAYSFRRKSFIGKKFIRQWYPDRVVRLYKKSACGYNTIGEHGKVETDNFVDLDIDMLHYSFENFGVLVSKADRFAVNLARVRYAEGMRASWYDPFLHGMGAMFKGLIIKGGVFGGLHEWHVAFASSYNSYMKYVVILEMQENEK